ncbi:uncharacterized protein LOC107882956 [Acyrthosiphon pisum]|uniref:Uncharacterized protein n=1 Tax=Acyrthosiphon pisum TaxID=7029 RepID=A0A8R2D361_ACYPI|nr:uncharacterized protein LOC107882956 [Acyrthosiphon pisum]|eukprot:XP_016657657.1 PREDICTED: uncharacterized protein LOC107882956 [Acyrthosiphon pisum]
MEHLIDHDYCILPNQIRFLENQHVTEFHQVSNNMKIRSGIPSKARELNTQAIENFIQQLVVDNEHYKVQTFLRRTGHRIDGYITQQIGPYPSEQELLLLNVDYEKNNSIEYQQNTSYE